MMMRLILIALLVAAAAFGLDPKTLQYQGYINDFADVLDPATEQDLNRYLGAVDRSTSAQIAIVTLNTLEDEPIEDFANNLFRHWGIGRKETDEGLLLLLVVNDRQSRLEVGRGLEPIITDGTSGSLLREMRPALRGNRYAEALGTAAHSLGERIARAKGVAISESLRPQRRVREAPQEFPWPVVVGGLLFLLFLGGMGRGGRRGGGGGFIPGLILGHMLNRSMYGGYGGGGFGGYDSGDSFGGFGGGDSGGGGASSNW